MWLGMMLMRSLLLWYVADVVIGKVNALISSSPVLVVYTSLGSVKVMPVIAF
jgi:hypothetical protein